MAGPLLIGDVTFQGRFNKVEFSWDGSVKLATKFKPRTGEQFVTLLIGTVPRTATHCDPVEMLKDIGFQKIGWPELEALKRDAALYREQVKP